MIPDVGPQMDIRDELIVTLVIASANKMEGGRVAQVWRRRALDGQDRFRLALYDGSHSWTVKELEAVGPEGINNSFGVLDRVWINGWLGQRLEGHLVGGMPSNAKLA